MKIIQDVAALLFVVAVGILTAVCMLGVWDVFGNDVIWKSFETVGLLALVSVIVIFASRFLGMGTGPQYQAPLAAFPGIRRVTLAVLIIAASLLALIGVLSIWDVITDKDTLYKSIGSLAILAFGAFVITVTCMEREKNPMLKMQSVSFGGAVGAVVLLYLIFAFSGLFY